MSQWVRLWDDMPTDPKWRVVARRSGRSIAEVIAVFNFMLVNAGANATERNGTLANFDDEDVAAALDIDACHVTSIREAMQGKTLDGDRLTGWERRQPKREDGAADRAKAWREKKKSENPEIERDGERNRTQANASERPEQIQSRADSDTEKEPETEKAAAALFDVKFELDCENAAGFGPLSGFSKIRELADIGFDPESRIVPIIRAVADGLRKSGKRPDSWLYFVPAIRDPDRKPRAQPPPTVFVPHGSPAWEAWCRTGGKSFPTITENGVAGWRFPSEYPPADEVAA